jgi:hypothetical protein
MSRKVDGSGRSAIHDERDRSYCRLDCASRKAFHS